MLATITHGSTPLILEGPIRRFGKKGELDTITYKVLTAAETATSELISLGFVRDEKLTDAGHSIWVDDITETPESDLLTEHAILCSGLITDGERRRRTISAGQREISVGPTEKVILAWTDSEKGKDPATSTSTRVLRRVPAVDEDTGEAKFETITTPSGSQERWNIKDSVLTVRDTYFTTTRPDTTIIGTANVPPNPPDPPPYIWDTYDGPKRGNHPNGWVLDDLAVDELHTSGTTDGLFSNTATWSYYYTELPD
jgi:hypothetical protein